MKKALKWIGIVAGSLVGILIIAAIILPFVLPLDKIKDFAVAKISETINREVKIESVSFNLFSGIKLKKLSISNAKGFAKKPFITADSIELRYAFWPLFKRQLLVKEFRLVKPEILIEKSATGVFNFSDLTKKKTPSKKAKKEAVKKEKEAKEAGFTFIMDTFSIRNARITYSDYGTKQTSEIKNANLTLSGITLAMLKPIDFKFSATAVYQKKNIPLSLSAKIALDLKKQIAKIPSLSLNIAGEKAAISATISRWTTGPTVDFSISSKKLSVDSFLALFAAGGPPKKKVKAKKGALTKTVNQATASISSKYRVTGNINIQNLTFKKFKIDKINLALSLANKRVGLNIKEVKFYEGTLSGKASVNLAASGLAYSVKNLKLKDFNSTPFVNTLVESFLTKMPDYKDMIDKVYGRLSANLSLSGRGVEVDDIMANAVGGGNFKLTGGEIKRMKTLAEVGKFIKSTSLQENIKFKDLGAGFSIKNRIVTVKNLKLESGDVKAGFKGGVNLGNLTWAPGNRLNLKLSPTATKGLSKEYDFFRDKNGWFELTFELTGSLKKPIPKLILDKPIEKVIEKVKLKIEAKKVEIQKQVEKKIEEEKKRLEEEAKKKLEEEAKKQLKNLIKL